MRCKDTRSLVFAGAREGECNKYLELEEQIQYEVKELRNGLASLKDINALVCGFDQRSSRAKIPATTSRR